MNFTTVEIEKVHREVERTLRDISPAFPVINVAVDLSEDRMLVLTFKVTRIPGPFKFTELTVPKPQED